MEKEVKVSFCIPVKNRLNDIKSTLRRNLDDNASDSNIIEFIVICFDDDPTETTNWIYQNFSNELDSGYLRYYHHNNLPKWHFGKAKNAFKQYIRGKIYASLDGDNFTGKAGGKHIIEIFERFGYNCVLHQFQGNWGDGTCGRISLNTDDYIQWGYDESFLPRQWDEMDAMLSVLVNRPGRKYVHYHGHNKNIINKSHPFRRFLNDHNILIEQVSLAENENKFESNAAVGEHDNSYVQNDALLRLSSIYNHLLSYIKNSNNNNNTEKYITEIKTCQQNMTEEIKHSINFSLFLDCKYNIEELTNNKNVFLVSCIKDEKDILSWLEHYRSVGVELFLIVDDNSKVSLEETLQEHDDVVIFKPKVGQFKFAKTMWLECILNMFCLGKWVYIVDSDEYAEPCFTQYDLEKKNPTLSFVERNKNNYFTGFLLDLYPQNPSLNRDINSFALNEYSHYQFRPEREVNHYIANNTTRWSYGDFSSWAYRIDIRYRTNLTFDSMRKFPLVKWQEKTHLNQGFHDLIIDKKKRSYRDLSCSNLIPIRHYKYRSIANQISGYSSKSIEQYHPETKTNIQKTIENFDSIIKACFLNPFSYEFISPYLIPTPFNRSITIINGKKERNEDECSAFGHELLYRYSELDPFIVGNIIFSKSYDIAVEYVKNNSPFNKYDHCDLFSTTLTIGSHSNSECYKFSRPIFHIGLAGTGGDILHSFLVKRSIKSIYWAPEHNLLNERKKLAREIHNSIREKIDRKHNNPIEIIEEYDAICNISCVIHNFEYILDKYPNCKVVFTYLDHERLRKTNSISFDEFNAFHDRITNWCSRFGPEKFMVINPIADGICETALSEFLNLNIDD